jgi:hypothetical protein
MGYDPRADAAMAEEFDAYHKWLGIAPKDQPPHHYRLLGIDVFEADGDVIASAADQRMGHVRSFQAGRHSALSQKILNQIAAARVCLLDAKKKAAYDGELRRQLTPPSRAPAPAPRPAAAAPAGSPPKPKSTSDDDELGFAPLAPLPSETKPAAGRSAARGKSPAAGDRIANDALTAAHLPPPNANWNQMGVFALSYNGYNHWPSHADCVEVANHASEYYEKLGNLPATLDELRTCLFVEYQRYLDFGWKPDERRMQYLRALVEEIRRRLPRRG